MKAFRCYRFVTEALKHHTPLGQTKREQHPANGGESPQPEK